MTKKREREMEEAERVKERRRDELRERQTDRKINKVQNKKGECDCLRERIGTKVERK